MNSTGILITIYKICDSDFSIPVIPSKMSQNVNLRVPYLTKILHLDDFE